MLSAYDPRTKKFDKGLFNAQKSVYDAIDKRVHGDYKQNINSYVDCQMNVKSKLCFYPLFRSFISLMVFHSIFLQARQILQQKHVAPILPASL